MNKGKDRNRRGKREIVLGCGSGWCGKITTHTYVTDSFFLPSYAYFNIPNISKTTIFIHYYRKMFFSFIHYISKLLVSCYKMLFSNSIITHLQKQSNHTYMLAKTSELHKILCYYIHFLFLSYIKPTI